MCPRTFERLTVPEHERICCYAHSDIRRADAEGASEFAHVHVCGGRASLAVPSLHPLPSLVSTCKIFEAAVLGIALHALPLPALFKFAVEISQLVRTLALQRHSTDPLYLDDASTPLC